MNLTKRKEKGFYEAKLHAFTQHQVLQLHHTKASTNTAKALGKNLIISRRAQREKRGASSASPLTCDHAYGY